jgi:hypothetical protein
MSMLVGTAKGKAGGAQSKDSVCGGGTVLDMWRGTRGKAIWEVDSGFDSESVLRSWGTLSISED